MVVTSRDLFSVGKQTFAATSILKFVDIELLVIIFVALLSIKKLSYVIKYSH